MTESKRRTHYRDTLAETRNPLLKLPSVRKLIEMPEDSKAVMRQLCLELSREANEQAQYCWKKYKAPMAAYWKAVSVWAKHFARLLK